LRANLLDNHKINDFVLNSQYIKYYFARVSERS